MVNFLDVEQLLEVRKSKIFNFSHRKFFRSACTLCRQTSLPRVPLYIGRGMDVHPSAIKR